MNKSKSIAWPDQLIYITYLYKQPWRQSVEGKKRDGGGVGGGGVAAVLSIFYVLIQN